MRFSEINLFGVYVAPISVMMIGAWLLFIPLRRIADYLGIRRHVWHPALFWLANYISLLSLIVLLVAL